MLANGDGTAGHTWDWKRWHDRELRRRGQKDEQGNSRPVRRLLGYRHVLLLFGFLGDGYGFNHGLSGLVVGRVASRAELLGDAALTKSVFNDLVERAAGVGDRLLVSRVAGTTTLSWRDAAETSSFVVFIFVIVVVTVTLPGGPTGNGDYYREVAVVRIVEIAISVGIY